MVMDGFRDDEGALALHSRELLTKSRLRRRRVRVRGPEGEKMEDARLDARNPFAAGEAPDRRRTETPKPSGVVVARGESMSNGPESESELERRQAAKPTTILAGNNIITIRLSGQRTSSLPAATKTDRPQRISPIPVFATARSTSTTAQPTSSDRVAAIGGSPSPPSSTPSRASAAASSSSSAVTSVSSPAAPVAAPVATPAAPFIIPDVQAPQSPQSTQTVQLPAAQETGFRLGVAKEQDGSEKDLRAGRFSQGAEAGIVIGTLSFIALLGMMIFCYRRKRTRSRGVSGLSSEKGRGFLPRRQTHIMDEAMTAAYAADDRAFSTRATPPMPTPLRLQERELKSPDQRPVYMARQPPQDPNTYPPERTPADQYRARSMPLSDEPEETWRTRNPEQSQATQPLNWL